MSTFIGLEDYNAQIKTEILNALIRDDEEGIEIAEDMAIEDMKGYMNQRYDCKTLFSAAGESRNKLVLMFAIDITLYHLHSANNPQRFPQIRKDRYDRAISWLKDVQAGLIVPNGVPLNADENGNLGGAATFSITSNPKRDNTY
jgi:phage gp36-like protein